MPLFIHDRFFPDAITSWNNIIIHFDNIPSINILKDHILSLIRPKEKNIFGIRNQKYYDKETNGKKIYHSKKTSIK